MSQNHREAISIPLSPQFLGPPNRNVMPLSLHLAIYGDFYHLNKKFFYWLK